MFLFKINNIHQHKLFRWLRKVKKDIISRHPSYPQGDGPLVWLLNGVEGSFSPGGLTLGSFHSMADKDNSRTRKSGRDDDGLMP